MRCEDEKMFYRPPLLEEPCAQTLSGKRKVSVMLYTCNVVLSLSMFHLSFHVWLMLLHDSYVSRFPADRRSSQAGPCQGRTGHPQAGYAFEPASGPAGM